MARKRTRKADGVTPKARNRKKKLQTLVPTKLSKRPKATRLSELQYDPKIFETMKTGTIVDTFFSNKGGIPRACNFIVVGDPGVGKSTIGLDIIANIGLSKEVPAKVLFISAEMNEIDMYEYMERYPKFGEIDIMFLGDYADENPKLAIEEMLATGYDLVLGDSFVEIQETIKEACFMTTSASEKWLLDLMGTHNKGGNKSKAYTTFLMIQQMTKGGTFVGSNKLKHMTSGMLEIRFSTEGNVASPRYIEFSKNRRGDVQKKLFFNLKIQNDVAYNSEKWKLDKDSEERLSKEAEELLKEATAFDALVNRGEITPTDMDNADNDDKLSETVLSQIRELQEEEDEDEA